MTSGLPDIRPGMRWQDLSAREMQALIDGVRRMNNLTAGNGLQINATPSGINISLSPTPLQKTPESIINVAIVEVVESPKSGDPFMWVRRVKYVADQPPEGEYAWDIFVRERAYPTFGKKVVDYAALVWNEDNDPTSDTQFTTARLVRQFWLVDFPGVATITQFRFKILSNDLIVCRTWDGTTEGDDLVLVAKPFLIRRSPFDRQSRNGISFLYSGPAKRIATKADGVMETQAVVPSYVLDDIIYAQQNIIGGTEVFFGDDELTWLDTNRDGRFWAKEFQT